MDSRAAKPVVGGEAEARYAELGKGDAQLGKDDAELSNDDTELGKGAELGKGDAELGKGAEQSWARPELDGSHA